MGSTVGIQLGTILGFFDGSKKKYNQKNQEKFCFCFVVPEVGFIVTVGSSVGRPDGSKVGCFVVESESAPPLWTFYIADEGDIAIFPNSDQTKVRALLRIQRAIPTYLYIGKNVDANVLSRVQSVNQTADEYSSITQRLNSFQFQF